MQHFQCRHSVYTQSMSDVYIYDSLNIYIFIKFFCIMFNTLVLLCNTHLCKPINKWELNLRALDSVSRSPVWQILLFALLPSISLLALIHWKCYCAFSLHPTQTKIITIIHRTEHIYSIQILCDIHNPLATNVTKNIVIFCTCFSSLLTHRLSQIYGTASGQSAHLAEVVIAAEVRQGRSLMHAQLMGLNVGR